MTDRDAVLTRLRRVPRLWFGLRVPVRRLEFAASGALLAPVKFILDSALFRAATGKTWSPLGYFHPFASVRFSDLSPDATWIVWVMAATTIPFLWIGASMTVRRCVDARMPASAAILFFIPVINWVFLAILCILPSHPEAGEDPLARPAGRRGGSGPLPLRTVLASIGGGAAVGLTMVVLSVALLGEYGLALFVGSPFVLGAVAACLYNRELRRPLGRTFAIAMSALLLAAATILLFALEGLICLAMAAPIAIPLALLGAWIGREIATRRCAPAAALGAMALALPALVAVDVAAPGPAMHEVRTSIVVNAPRDVVWRRVLAFPEIPAAHEIVFRAGIAAPLGARIDGVGVGASRRCTFTTGAFIEPITAWNAPERLAFDVTAQPPPMHELSPWSRVFAPHLDRALVSRRGEFLLTPLSEDRTLLQGTTWYTLDLEPAWYWTSWADTFIHAIHRRVLEHVAGLAEHDVAGPPG